MTDNVSPSTRSWVMAQVRGVQTGPEIELRHALWAAGARGWRNNVRSLPGKPDIVFRRRRVAVFIDGCFWHGHDCKRNLVPKRNAKAWADKISNNQSRDRKVTRELKNMGWKVVRVWECSLIKDPNIVIRRIVKSISKQSIGTVNI